MRIIFSFLIAFFFVGYTACANEEKLEKLSVAENAVKTQKDKNISVIQPVYISKVKPTSTMRIVDMQIRSSPLEYVRHDLSNTDENSTELPQNLANMSELVQFDHENFDEVVKLFINNCKTAVTRKMYGSLCESALHVSDKKVFIKNNFKLYKIVDNQKDEGILTGYYEPELRGSLTKHDKYIYPLYQKPTKVDSIASAIFNIDTNGSVTQESSRANLHNLNSAVLCYVDNKIDEFFLEIQGSGRIDLDTNQTLYVGYSGSNGQKYSSIGKYLIEKGYMSANHMSLENIKAWAKQNPEKIDEVLNQNQRVIYFKKRDSKNVTGSLGVPLTPMRSVAIDSAYVPLGSMLFIDAKDYNHSIKNIVFAQDRGAAIKSAVRADLFTGYGKEALAIAGNLKAKLKMWIFLPKTELK